MLEVRNKRLSIFWLLWNSICICICPFSFSKHFRMHCFLSCLLHSCEMNCHSFLPGEERLKRANNRTNWWRCWKYNPRLVDPSLVKKGGKHLTCSLTGAGSSQWGKRLFSLWQLMCWGANCEQNGWELSWTLFQTTNTRFFWGNKAYISVTFVATFGNPLIIF